MKINDELMVNVYRSGRIESQHLGSVAVVDFDNNLVAHYGDVDRELYLRSAAKPVQAIPTFADSECMEHFMFTSEERALMTGSINGEKRHQEIGKRILDKIGLGIEHMQCGIHPPVDRQTADEMRERGEQYTELCHNCAGNHLVMLALTVHRGWPLENYTDPGHPFQQEVLKWVSLLSGVPKDQIHIGLDGCTAPVHFLSMREIALCFARFSNPERLNELPNPDNLDIERGGNAMQMIIQDYWDHPGIMGGRNRFDTLMNTLGNGTFYAKGGGEGFEITGVVSDGLGIAVKIMDGDMTKRAKSTSVLETMLQLGFVDEGTLTDAPDVKKHYRPSIPNQRGIIDQEIIAVFKLKK